MDNSTLYSNIFNKALGAIKVLKEQWNQSNQKSEDGFFDIEGIKEDEYRYVKEQCNAILENALQEVVIKLVGAYDRGTTLLEIFYDEKKMHYIEPKKEYYFCSGRIGRTLLSIEEIEGVKTLCIFKPFGMNNRLPRQILHQVGEDYDFDSCKYISFVSKNAHKEMLDTTNPETDETSDCDTYSLKYYIEQQYGPDEYKAFCGAVEAFNEAANQYMGLKVVRTLKPNTIFHFKNSLLEKFETMDFMQMIASLNLNGAKLETSQKEILDKQCFEQGYISAIVGNSEFAKSFITAEWLYEAIGETGYIDETAIAMGYLKSVEQLLFTMLELNTKERTGRNNKFDAGNQRGVYLTDENLKEKKDYISLDNLKYFFGRKENISLFRDEVNGNLFKLLCEVINNTKELRNEFFHKENIHNWDTVKRIRTITACLIYLMLGAYKFTESDLEHMGIIAAEDNAADDYYRLCEFFHNTAISGHGNNLPVFYMNGATECDCYICKPDIKVEYKDNEKPRYSGIYLQHFGPNNPIISVNENGLPDKIMMGRIYINGRKNCELKITGPVKVVYEKGKFML